MPKDVKLSDNFYLSEFVKSQTAIRLGIDNWPQEPEVISNLVKLSINVLQPVRYHFEAPVYINSGYRCTKLNRMLGSRDTSQHTKGQAADIEIPGYSNYDVAIWISENLDYDQCILEHWDGVDPRSGWIHVTYVSPELNRNQDLTINKNGTSLGFRAENE